MLEKRQRPNGITPHHNSERSVKMKCEATVKLEYTMPGMLKPQTDERENFHRRLCLLPKPHPCTSIIELHKHAQTSYTPIPCTLFSWQRLCITVSMATLSTSGGGQIWAVTQARVFVALIGASCCVGSMFGLFLERGCWKGISWSLTGRSKRNKFPNSLYQTSQNENILYTIICCQIRRSFATLP